MDDTTQIRAMKLKKKAGILISIMFIIILVLTGYRIWRSSKLSCMDLPQSVHSNELDDFKVGNGTSIFLISKLHPSSKNVFFVKTSCNIDQPGHLNLSSEQARSITTAAIQNPSKKVILFYTCPNAKFINLKTILDLPNFHLVHINQTSNLFDRVYKELVPNNSGLISPVTDDNLIKFLIIYEFGGTYMNLDLVNVRPLDNLGVNFICAESEYSIGDYFFNFEPKHQFLKELLSTEHKRNTADRMTTGLLTSVLRKFCSLEELFKFDKFHNLAQCNLKVLAPNWLCDSGRTKGNTPKCNLLMNETKLRLKPRFIHKNVQNFKIMETNGPTKKHHSEMDGHGSEEPTFHAESDEYASSVFQTDDYWTYRKLSPSSNNIYFLETSCTNLKPSKPSYTLVISARQACAIHSTAFYNPSREVILLYSCHGFVDISSGLAKTLFELPNFSMARINLTDFFSNTLDMRIRVSLKKSEFFVHQNADILRLLVLFLFGGTYMDLDIISLKSLTDLGINFIGAEYNQSVANGILSFEAQHKFIKKCLKEAIHSYQPSEWVSVGPSLLLLVIKGHCGLQMVPQKNLTDWEPFKEVRHFENCNMTVLPSRYFYAVPYWNWTRFYSELELPDVLFDLQHSYIAHFWNHMGSPPVYMFGDQPYAKLAKQHCNAIFEFEHKRGRFYLE